MRRHWRKHTPEERRKRATAAGKKGGAVSKYPLQAVLGTTDHPDLPRHHIAVEVLACGHWMDLRSGGRAPAARRRCLKCARGRPLELDVAAYLAAQQRQQETE